MISRRFTVEKTRNEIEDTRVVIIELLEHYRHVLRETEDMLARRKAGGKMLVELLKDREFFRKQVKRCNKGLAAFNHVDLIGNE